MGKKSKILYYSVLIVSVACFILDYFFEFPFFRISFGLTIVLIGLLLIIRSVNLKLDSSMFFGIALFLLGVLQILKYFMQNKLTNLQIVPYYLFSIALASVITGLYFKDRLQLKLFILFLGFGLITLLFSQKLLELGWYIGIMVAWFVLYFVTNLVIFKKRSK